MGDGLKGLSSFMPDYASESRFWDSKFEKIEVGRWNVAAYIVYTNCRIVIVGIYVYYTLGY